MTPAKVPQPVFERLGKEMTRILTLLDVTDKLRSEGSEPLPMSLADTAKFIRNEIAQWRQALQGADFVVA